MIWNPWATFLYALALLVVFAGVIDGQPLEKGQTTVRPYQFGFTIEEQQHRFEKRDERGIVMGEFGFITADGIYHVTVYATDEEGKFRILAMRNYPYESPPKTIEMIVKPNAKPVIITTTTTAKPIVEKKPLPKYNFNTKACSGCFLKNDIVKDAPEQDTNLGLRPVLQPPTITNTITGKPVQSSVNTLNKSVASSGAKTPTTNSSPDAPPVVDIRTSDKAIAPQKPLSNAQNPTVQQQAGAVPSGGKLAKGSSTSGGVQKSGTQNAGSGNSSPNSPSSKSSSTAAGDNGDLYHFKYLLDYNGHEETGARNGNKVGNFFSIGDDNVERTIEYIANEFGYQPRIRWRKLDAARTKPAENALKDYEFVWFRKD